MNTTILIRSVLLAITLFSTSSILAGDLSGPGKLPPATDLRPALKQWGLLERQQGGRPTCSSFTVAAALEYAVARRQGHGTRLSVEFLNWAANAECGDAEDGAFFSDLWKGFSARGICVEEDMPYQPAFDPTRQPGAAAMADAKTRLPLGLRLHWIKEWNVNTGLTGEHLAAIKATLHRGWPVCGGFRWPKQEKWENNVLQMCDSSAVRDGHSVLLVGYRDDAAQPGGGVFLFRNTSHGGLDGMMPYGYAIEFMNDAVWVDFEARTQAAVNAGSPALLFQDSLGALTAKPAGRNCRVSSNELPQWNDANLDMTILPLAGA